MDADGSHAVRHHANTVDEWFPSLSPDGALVLFVAAANAEFQPYYNGRAFVAPAGGGPARILAPAFPHPVERATWWRDGKEVLLAANLGVRNEVFLLDVATQLPPITDGRHELIGSSFVPERERLVGGGRCPEPRRAVAVRPGPRPGR